MLTASPITNQPVGKTFTVAICVLGLGAFLELVLIGWAFGKHPPIAIIPTRPLVAARVASSATPAAPTNPATPAPAPGMRSSLDTAAAVAEPKADLTATAAPTATPAPIVAPKPTPLTVAKPATPEPISRFDELVLQGKELRERGDTGAAIVRFGEAAVVQPKNPSPLAELAATYEKMGMGDKAAENWKKILDLGPNTGGIYYTLAEEKLKNSQLVAIRQATTPGAPAAEQSPDMSAPVDGIAAGAILGLLKTTVEDKSDDLSAKHFVLHIPIKARPKVHIDVKDLVIHVLFYDIVDGQNVVQTSADVNSKWTTPPADWINSDTEELAVDYNLRKEAHPSKRDTRKYFGYIVRIYYKSQLQAAAADPQRLAQQYPPPLTLPKENEK